MTSNLSCLPPTTTLAALASSAARRTAFSMSLPMCDCGPVSGATMPIFTIVACAHDAWVPGAGCFCSVQPEMAAAVIATATRWKRVMAASDSGCGKNLLDGENVFRERLGLVVAHRRVRRHRDRAPHAGRSFLDLLHEIGLGVLAGLVLRRDLLVRRTDQLLVGRVAAQAGLVLEQLLRVRGQRRAARQRQAERGRNYEGFHAVS